MLDSWPLWGKIALGVGAAGAGYVVLKIRAASKAQAAGNDSAQPANQMPATQPLLLPGGGTGPGNNVATPNLPLGGEVWRPPTVPLSENVDYQTAVLNANVQKSALEAQTGLQAKYLDWLIGSSTTSPDANFDTRKEIRGSSIVEGSNYLKSILPKVIEADKQGGAASNAAYTEIYNKAKQAGYSATEVSQSLQSAGYGNISVAQVRQWISDRGLTPL